MPAVVLAQRGSSLSGFTARVPTPVFLTIRLCAAYLEAIRWRDGFVCGWCGEASEPYRFTNRPQVLRCRKCQRDNALTAGTVMERTRTPLSIWFWAALPGFRAIRQASRPVQFQRQLGLNRYEDGVPDPPQTPCRHGPTRVATAFGGQPPGSCRDRRGHGSAAQGDPSVAEDFLPISPFDLQ